ncbi:MAG: 3'-5' exonuclease [Chloroflexota bacterium]|nr:3'-5' exonuclease [Chloroflexota bacterium]
MAKMLDKVIVIDLEATCWEGDPPAGQVSEIIEIGLCVLDVATGERSAPRAILVKPQRSTLSHYCTKLTTLTPEMLKDGLTFPDACSLLQDEYQSRQRTWASYGDYDRLQFMEQCETWGVPYPFGRSHINVKNLLALHFNLKHEVNLQKGTGLVGLPFEGTIHRGIDDAWNIAAVLSRVLLGRDRQQQLAGT